MKPCPRYRQSIAWLAADSLTESDAAAVRAHLNHCPNCRGYAQQFTNLCADLAQLSDSVPDTPLAGSLAERVIDRVRAAEARPPSMALGILAWFRTRPGLATLGTSLVVAAVLVAISLHAPRNPRTTPPAAIRVATTETPPPPGSPTYSAYRNAARVSLEQLEALLAAQSAPAPALPSSPPLLTAMDARLLGSNAEQN
jgi:anti-sigma factor RsiW